MPTYCKMEEAAGLSAGAQDVFAAVGTVTLRPGPGMILALLTNGAPNANTAAEAIIPQFRFDLGEVGLKEVLVTGMGGVGESIATQSGGFGLPAQITAVNIPFKGNERIPITATWHASGTPTAGLNAQASVLYSQPPHPPPAWFNMFPYLHPIQGSDSEANAAVTAEADIADLQIPSFAQHICGFGSTMAQDAAPRTAEDVVMALTFTSTFPDFTPQEYPFMSKFPNLAGTLVGKGIQFPYMKFPAWIPTNRVSGQITPRVDFVTVPTDAHAISADVFYTTA